MKTKTEAEAVSELQTVQDLLRWTVSQLNTAPLYYGHGSDNSWDEARYLVLSAVMLPPDTSTALYTARLTRSERKKIVCWVKRRVEERVPVAYLTHSAWFCGLSFYVDERVLIPRSPIGELILNRFGGYLIEEPQRILDMCTGSGCIAIACAYSYPQAEIDAVDNSQDALAVAEYNIQSHSLEEQVTPICSDLFTDLPLDRYDLIIANPPYVDRESMECLPEEYRYEPVLALDGGGDGLDVIHRLLCESADYLGDQGILVGEVGMGRVQLEQKYPMLPFTWLPLQYGGDGVFMVTRQQLIDYFQSVDSWLESNGRE